MRNILSISVIALCLLVFGSAISSVSAQQTAPRVEAKFDADTIIIGDQFHLNVRVERDVMQVVEFPLFESGVMGQHFEILEEGGVDTVSVQGRAMVLQKCYLLTCFDAGQYTLQPYPVFYADKNVMDTIWSADSLRIFVDTFAIDTLKQVIHDIKPPLKAPRKFGEYGGYLIFILFIIGAIVIILYYFLYLASKRKARQVEVPDEPAHVLAIRRLEDINARKLWQSGKMKQYYTEITDTLRGYIERRYNRAAMEMTSDEILAALDSLQMEIADTKRLTEVLRTADLVKFAKYIPDAQQNERVYNSAYNFVEDTKENLAAEPTQVAQITEEEKL